MRLAKTEPGDASSICTFETGKGERFSIPRPAISQEEEAERIEALRGFLGDEDLH